MSKIQSIRLKENKIIVDLDNFVYLLCTVYIYALVLTDIVRKIGILTGNINIVDVFRNCMYIFVFLCVCYHMIKNKVPSLIIGISIIYLLLFTVSISIYPSLIVIVKDTLTSFFARCLCGFYLMIVIKNWNALFEKIASWSIVLLIYSVFAFAFGRDMFSNYMSMAYGILIPGIITFFVGIKKKNIFYTAVGAISWFSIFVYGARGPLLCLAGALIYMTLARFFNGNSRKIILRNIALIILTICGYVFYCRYYFYLIRHFHSKYPDSRTITAIINNNFMGDSGRNDLYNIIIDKIKEDPISPRGIYSDRVLIGNSLNASSIDAGGYAHNMILEICFQFGCVIGGIIIILFFLILFTMSIRIIKKGNYYLQLAFATLIIPAIVMHMVSGSYLDSFQFWLCLGTMINLSRTLNQYKT